MSDEKLRYMMDLIASDVVAAIIEDTGVPAREAMNAFYNSEVFQRLTDAGTGLYSQSGGYVYDLYKIEKKHGRLVQMEI
jgi:3-hydroxyacyl-CoA dehydrogenase